MVLMKKRRGNGDGVSRAIASSIPKRNVRMIMRTLTSQASHCRSSNIDCMPDPDSVLFVPRPPSIFQTVDDAGVELFSGQSGPGWCARTALRPKDSRLAGQLGDHREQWHIQRNYDATD